MSVPTKERVKSLIYETIDKHPTILKLCDDVGDLRQDVNGLRTDVDGLRTDVDGLRTDVDGLRTDVNGLRTDVDGLRTDVNGLRTDVDGLRTDVNGLREEVRWNGVVTEDIQANVRRILEVVTPAIQKTELVDQHSQTLDTLQTDVTVTQQVLKAHIADKDRHHES